MRAVIALWRVMVRRDALQLTLWILGNALMALVAIGGVNQSYGTLDQRRELLATVMANPVILLFRGLPSGPDHAPFVLFLILPFLVMIAAFMSSFLAVRHTRADEEEGRTELIGATPAARGSAFTATVLHGVVANLLTAVMIALAFIVGGLPVGGSFVAGAAVGAAGLSFLAIALLGAQLFSTSRGANTFGVAMIMITFLMCGFGNASGTPSADLTRMTSGPLAWFSPFGWAENTRPFADDDVRPILLCVGFAIVVGAVSAVLLHARDVGASFVPGRRGPQRASWALRGPTSMVWRFVRSGVLWWAVGSFFTGALATGLASVVGTAAKDNAALAKVLTSLTQGGSLVAGTVTIFMTMVGVLASCAVVQVMVRARQEEARGSVEPVWAAPVGRQRWLLGYVINAAVTIVIVCLAAVLGAAAGLAKSGPDAEAMRDAWIVVGGQAAAAGVFIVVAALLVILLPRASVAVSWALVLVAVVVGFFGPIFGLPQGFAHVSPIADAPTIGASGTDLRGLWWLLAVIVVGVAASLVLVRRRPLVPAG
ncbi:ABC transporter permease [Microbacterium gorillae]|uniref:ABC transporter permease n=1 Tax=Microbacterium gorillae TaxID=1231063 RepID=UPI000590AEAB|nr:hypothetical protein [Microbacterium gorillae]